MKVTTDQIKQVFLNLNEEYVTSYKNLEEFTGYNKKILKECIKILKEIGVIYIEHGTDEDTGLLAGRGFCPYSEAYIKRQRGSEISETNYQKFLLIME